MTFGQLPSGASVFLDANPFVYHFAPDPRFQATSSQLLQRIENQDLVGYTSTAILSEVAHRLMTIEARARFRWSSGKIVVRLRQNPASVKNLTAFRTAIENILQSRIQVLSISPSMVLIAATVAQQNGLLANDALLVAVMQHHHLTHLASNDADFDRVAGLTRHAPA